MNLSPLDIRRQQFTKTFRGYDPAEVDAFLKQVSDQVEGSQEEVRRAEERVRDAEAKLIHYEKVELALQEALESARETARRAEASAEERARLIIEEAELKAQRIVHDAEHERYGLRQDVANLNARQSEVAARLRGFLLSELEILAQFQGDDPVGFIKLQPAGASGGTLPPAPPRQIEASASEPEAPAPEASAPPASETEELRGTDAHPSDDSFPTGGDYAEEVPEEPAPVAEPAFPEAAPTPAPEPEAPTPEAEPPSADVPAEPEAPAETPMTGAYTPTEEPTSWPPASTPSEPDPEPEPEEPAPPPAVTGGWDLRSLVTGEERSVAASEAERERIRRILDDLD